MVIEESSGGFNYIVGGVKHIVGIEIYGGGFLYSMGDFNIVWGDCYIVWEIFTYHGGFLYSMGDSTIVITARFRFTRTCFRLKRKRNFFYFDSLGNDFLIGILI